MEGVQRSRCCPSLPLQFHSSFVPCQCGTFCCICEAHHLIDVVPGTGLIANQHIDVVPGTGCDLNSRMFHLNVQFASVSCEVAESLASFLLATCRIGSHRITWFFFPKNQMGSSPAFYMAANIKNCLLSLVRTFFFHGKAKEKRLQLSSTGVVIEI